MSTVVPRTERLVFGDGVSGHTFSGIQFQHAAWNAPSSGFGYLDRYGGVRYLPSSGSAGYALEQSLAAVTFHRSNNIAFEHCDFRMLGG